VDGRWRDLREGAPRPLATVPGAREGRSSRQEGHLRAAFYRATAAALVQRVPEIAGALRQGTLCLTTVVEVAKGLTPENRETVLPRFFGLPRREAQEVVAELRPREAPPLRDVVTLSRPAVAATAALPLAPSPSGPDLRQVGQPTTPGVASREERTALAAEALAPPAPPAPPPPAPSSSSPGSSPGPTSPSRGGSSRSSSAPGRRSPTSRPGAGMAEILEVGLDLVLDETRRGFGDALVDRCVQTKRGRRSGPPSSGDPGASPIDASQVHPRRRRKRE